MTLILAARNTGTLYDLSQTRDDADQAILFCEDEGVVGLLCDAWPVAVTVEHGELHQVTEGVNVASLWADLALVTEAVDYAARRGLEIDPAFAHLISDDARAEGHRVAERRAQERAELDAASPFILAAARAAASQFAYDADHAAVLVESVEKDLAKAKSLAELRHIAEGDQRSFGPTSPAGKVAAAIVAEIMRGHFEARAAQPLPEGWSDQSWHMDAAPKYRVGVLEIWVGHPDPAKREIDGPRYAVFDAEVEDGVELLATDDWADVLAAVA